MTGVILSDKEVTNILNEQDKEIKSLKKENEHYEKMQKESLELIREQRKTVERLTDENEQLKQQLKQLKHWNKCLAEKRHQELSYRPYTASKSEKELK